MITFKQFLHAKGKLPKTLKVDFDAMTDRQRKQYEEVRQEHLKKQQKNL